MKQVSIEISSCPGTLSNGYETYSPTALKRMFNGKKVSHLLPYLAPNLDENTDQLFVNNRKQLSISGVQEKFSVLLEKNKLRLIKGVEQGQYILKPIPSTGKNPEQMPANEHLSMQLARQVFGIETAENALIFFQNASPAYITKRFDIDSTGEKLAQEDFATLAQLTPQTHGENYKYKGNYLDLFMLVKKYVPAYPVESLKLYKLIVFNYLIANGDAHYKNFSLIETSFGDFKLSPAYDLLNSRMHMDDNDFALNEGLLPPQFAKGKIRQQFINLGEMAGLSTTQIGKILTSLTSKTEEVKQLIQHSFLSEKFKRNYEQTFLTRLKKLTKDS